jgi:beta-glucosidase
MIGMNPDGTLTEKASMRSGPTITSEVVAVKLLNHFNILFGQKSRIMAEWNNRIQEMAERTRLGIPVTISSDPRHAFSNNLGANLPPVDFSQWPEPTGLAATRDEMLVEEFGDIARQEYLAVGIRVALHPMADGQSLYSRLPRKNTWTAECRLHDKAFSRRRSAIEGRRSSLLVR